MNETSASGVELPSRSALSPVCSRDLEPLFWYPQRLAKPSGWWSHVPFAFWLVANAHPRVLVELGTENGVSYSAFCEAVVRKGGCVSRSCRVSSTSLWPVLRANQVEIRRRFAIFRRRFDRSPVIDGLHTYEAVKHDFEAWRPKLSSRAIVLFHDTIRHPCRTDGCPSPCVRLPTQCGRVHEGPLLRPRERQTEPADKVRHQ
jgi:O-antigen biosynthesis protein